MSWLAHFDQDPDALDSDAIANVLAAIAPIIGSPRVVSAAETALAATRFAEDAGPL
jgi:hypothetical protein